VCAISKPRVDRDIGVSIAQEVLCLHPRCRLDFEFKDSPSAIVAHGTVWIPLIVTNGVTSWGAGAIVDCNAERGSCLLTQFYDAGHTTTQTTYKISRWDADRVEAEDGRTNVGVSDRYRQILAVECLILNRKAQQVFFAEKRDGQACRQIDPQMINESLARGRQLSARSGNAFNCPNLVRG